MDKKVAQLVKNVKKESGFSLIEILIVVAIIASIVFTVSSFQNNINFTQGFLEKRLQSRQDIDPALQIMAREIRSVGQSALGAYPIEQAGTSSIIFYSDIDNDGIAERVRYSINAYDEIEKGIIVATSSPLIYDTNTEATSTIVTDIVMTPTTTPFIYFNESYTGSEQALAYPINIADIRVVNFSADVLRPDSLETLFFTQTITLRNLRSN